MLPCKFCGCIQLLLFSRLTILVRNANATYICKWQTTATLVQYSDRLKSSSLGKVKKKRNRPSLPSKRGSKKNISLLFGPISFRHLTAVLSLDFFIHRRIFFSFSIFLFRWVRNCGASAFWGSIKYTALSILLCCNILSVYFQK